jgi:hypothetical protein
MKACVPIPEPRASGDTSPLWKQNADHDFPLFLRPAHFVAILLSRKTRSNQKGSRHVMLMDIYRSPSMRLFKASMQIACRFSFVQIVGRFVPAVLLFPRLVCWIDAY